MGEQRDRIVDLNELQADQEVYGSDSEKIAPAPACRTSASAAIGSPCNRSGVIGPTAVKEPARSPCNSVPAMRA